MKYLTESETIKLIKFYGSRKKAETGLKRYQQGEIEVCHWCGKVDFVSLTTFLNAVLNMESGNVKIMIIRSNKMKYSI